MAKPPALADLMRGSGAITPAGTGSGGRGGRTLTAAQKCAAEASRNIAKVTSKVTEIAKQKAELAAVIWAKDLPLAGELDKHEALITTHQKLLQTMVATPPTTEEPWREPLAKFTELLRNLDLDLKRAKKIAQPVDVAPKARAKKKAKLA